MSHKAHIKHPVFLTILVLALIPISQLAVDIYLPSLPAIARSLHTTANQAQLSFTFYLIGLGVMGLVYGPVSDRIGRRVVVLFGLVLFALGSVGCALAPSILILNLARLLQGVGGAAVFVVSNAIFSDAFEGRALAVRVTFGSLVWSLVPIIAPALGGFLQSTLGWRSNFYVMLTYTVIVALLLLVFLPETLDKNHTHAPSVKNLLSHYWEMLTHNRFLSLVTCVTFSYGGVIVFNLVGPFILQDTLHVTPYIYGLYVLLVGVIYSLAIYLNTVLLRFFTGMQLIAAGVTVTLLGGVALLVFHFIGWFSVLSVLIGIGLIQVGQGLIFANCLAGALATFPKFGGSVSSLFGSVLLIAVMFISAIIAALHITTQLHLAFVYLILGGLAVAGLLPIALAKKQ